MSTAAGPSKKKSSKKAPASPSPVSASVISDSGSDAESVDSDDIDDEVRAPVKAAVKSRKGGLPRYEPPPGMEEVSVSVSFKTSPMEFDALANKPGVEVWAIRVPAELRASRLGALTVSKLKADSVKGSLSTKSGDYILENAGGDSGAGAEMDGLSLMVPHLARGGKLYRVPITRRLLLTPTEGGDSDSGFVAPPKRKREQPAHLLKFRNKVFGFETAGHETTVVEGEGEEEVAESDGDVKMEETVAATPKPKAIATPKEKRSEKKDKSKKKSDDASPAKKKKKSKD